MRINASWVRADGFYTVPMLSIWLQQYFIDQRLFLTDASGNNIYFMSFTQNINYYANQIITRQVATTGLTTPSGFPFPPTDEINRVNTWKLWTRLVGKFKSTF